MYIYIYGPAFEPPPGHGHGSAIVLPPLPAPVVWWGCGTVGGARWVIALVRVLHSVEKGLLGIFILFFQTYLTPMASQ